MGTLLLACATPTQITIDISTNALCASQGGTADRLDSTLIVGAPDLANASYDEITVTKQCDAGAGDSGDNEVGTLVFVPADDNESRQLSVAVFAGVVRPDGVTKMTSEQCRDYFVSHRTIEGQPCILARRKLGFVDNTRLFLPVQLDTLCVGVECGEDQTCASGKCVDAAVTCDDTHTCDPPTTSTTVGAGGSGGGSSTGGGGSTSSTGGGGSSTGGGGSSTGTTTASSTISTGGGGSSTGTTTASSTISTGGGGSSTGTTTASSTISTGGGGSSTGTTTASSTISTGGGGNMPITSTTNSASSLGMAGSPPVPPAPIPGSSTPSLAGNPFADDGSNFLGVFEPHLQRSVSFSTPAPIVARRDATSIISAAPGAAWDSARVVVATRDGAAGRVTTQGALADAPASERDDAHDRQHVELDDVSFRATQEGLAACVGSTCAPVFLGPELEFLDVHALTAAALGDGRYVIFAAGEIEGYPMLVRAVVRMTPDAGEIVRVGTVEELGTGGLGEDLRDVWVDPRSGALWVVASEGVFVLDVGEAGY